ncbi:MAG: class I SAM-dependent methyltransferase [Methanoregula sp.]|nr:class I SAM-dependent methyltransferase [Methanoregula sp.]
MEPPQTDWNDVWKYLSDRSKNQHSKEQRNPWGSKENAIWFLKESKKHTKWTEQILQNLPLSDEYKVLDIGAGPGRMAIPMSGRVAHITTIEPGAGMMEVLKEQVAEHDVHNITTIPKRWEDVDIGQDLEGPYDLVIAFGSLGGMPDIRDAVMKMCVASRKWVYLSTGAGISTGEQKAIDLWPVLHGCEFYPGPRADILYNVLYDMGIYPNVKSEQRNSIQTYPDMESAVQRFRKNFLISSPEQEMIMRDYLKATLETGENGYFLRQQEYPVIFWWDVSEIDQSAISVKSRYGHKNGGVRCQTITRK